MPFIVIVTITFRITITSGRNDSIRYDPNGAAGEGLDRCSDLTERVECEVPPRSALECAEGRTA